MAHQQNEGDSQLVDRVRHGDLDAYGELVRRHQDQARAAAYVILGDRQEAEDATQEAFTSAFRALERFRPDGSFRAWLLRITVNEAHDLLSARHRRADLLSRAAGQLPMSTGAESAEAAALGERRREAVLAALFDLPETDRLVVTCRYFLDMPEPEIAYVLGIARGTVKSRLSRALARLGPIIRDLGPLVMLPPMVDLQHAVLAHIGPVGAGSAKGFIASTVAKLRSNARQVATAAGAGAAAVVAASVVMVSNGRSAPTPSPPEPQRFIVYGGDLTAADQQALSAAFGSGATATDSVSHQEMTATLTAQGIPVLPSDAALSSVQLVCAGGGSGLEVRTQNITRLTPAEYGAALITAGVYDVFIFAAAPAGKSVSGETALVGVFKAYPGCGAQTQTDGQRIRLAYQQLKIVDDMADDASELSRASAVVLDVLNVLLAGNAPDAASLTSALDAAAAREGVSLDDNARSEAAAYFEQLRGVDYGPYRQGLSVQQIGQDDVRVLPAQ